MPVSVGVRNLLEDNDFTYSTGNLYTGTPALVKPISRIRLGRRIYTNCAVVVETWANNFYVVKICGIYRAKVHEITRETLGSVDQMVDRFITVDEQQAILDTRVAWSNMLSS